MVNIQEAKTHLSRLLEEVGNGGEVVIAKAGKPIARLVPFREARGPRTLGRLAGHFYESENSWRPEAEFEASLDDPKFFDDKPRNSRSRPRRESSHSRRDSPASCEKRRFQN